jgi:hypothetical protein
LLGAVSLLAEIDNHGKFVFVFVRLSAKDAMSNFRRRFITLSSRRAWKSWTFIHFLLSPVFDLVCTWAPTRICLTSDGALICSLQCFSPF